MDGDVICAAFDLGRPLGEPLIAAEGWGGHNRVWKVATAEGVFAVKETRRPPPGRESLRIEADAVERGMPAPRPILTVDGEVFIHVGDAWLRCHEWIAGRSKKNEDTDVEDARAMGSVLGALHRLRLDGRPPAAGEPFGRDHWLGLAARAPQTPWAQAIAEEIEAIERAEAIAVWEFDEDIIGSHRDLNAHNILFGQNLTVIDWDAAGGTTARFERANYSTLWAQRAGGRLDADATISFLRSYRDVGGDIDADDPSALTRWLTSLIDWAELNVRLALDGIGDDQQELAAYLVRAVARGPDTIAKRRSFLDYCLTRL